MRDFLRDFVEDTANANERVFAVARGAMTAAVLARFFVVELRDQDPARILRIATEMPFYLASLGFSAWILLQGRRRRLTQIERTLSVMLDAAFCFGLLVGDVVWPWEGYQGILQTPDAAAILITAVAAGYRLSMKLAWVAGALNLASLAGLWAMDLVLGRRSVAPYETLVLYSLYFGAGVALAMLQVRRTESLVHRVAEEAQHRLRTDARLKVVLHAQHDVRSPLAAATLNAGLLRERLRSPTTPDTAALVEDLANDLNEASKLIDEHRTNLTLERPIATVSARTLQLLLTEVSPKLQALKIETDLRSKSGMAVAGGDWGMRRLLLNLLVNAGEGDGSRGASRCLVRTSTEGSMVRLTLEDDGPGFPPSILAAAPRPGRTTKEQGSGLGLTFVQWVVEDSGGVLACANHAGGAQVSVLFLQAGEEAP